MRQLDIGVLYFLTNLVFVALSMHTWDYELAMLADVELKPPTRLVSIEIPL